MSVASESSARQSLRVVHRIRVRITVGIVEGDLYGSYRGLSGCINVDCCLSDVTDRSTIE
jgi:hypothetical protein